MRSRSSLLGVVWAIPIGALTAIQAQVNGALGRRIGDGFVAALWSFGSGLTAIILISVFLPSGRAGFARLVALLRAGDIPWWLLAGGVAGAVTVATQGLTVAVIGVSAFTVGLVGGQTVGGLLLDRIGFGPRGVVFLTAARVIGSVLTVAAVVITLVPSGKVPGWMLVLPFAAGVGVSWQSATNGRLRVAVATPITATLVNFIGGTLALAVVAAMHLRITAPALTFPTAASDLWLYTGGFMGMIYIATATIIVRYTGVLLLGMGTVLGMLVAAFVIDVFWPPPDGAGLGYAVGAIAVALAGAAIASWPRRQPPARRPQPG